MIPAPRTTSDPCTTHRIHTPAPAYSELHHVIPQAWQAHWQPTKPWPLAGPSPDRPNLTLWDAREVILCRTGHGNVHYWLVKLTRQLDLFGQQGSYDPDDPTAWDAALKVVRHDARGIHQSTVHAELEISRLALARFRGAGGSVTGLLRDRLWGQI